MDWPTAAVVVAGMFSAVGVTWALARHRVDISRMRVDDLAERMNRIDGLLRSNVNVMHPQAANRMSFK